jgi:YHS domain-containing protein
MFRAFLELLFTIVIIIAARALLTTLFKGLSQAGSMRGYQQQAKSDDASRNGSPGPSTGSTANELHKDPVCGTYVAESTPYRKQTSGQMFYYCSDACREKHALVAR